MPRTRSIKPEFWTDEKLAKVSREARLFFVGLWKESDDRGICRSNPVLLKSNIFPYDTDLPLDAVVEWLGQFKEMGLIFPYKATNGEEYFWIKSFKKHQKIDHPAKTLYNPEPPGGLEKLSRETSEGHAKPSRAARASSSKRPRQTETKTETETKDKRIGDPPPETPKLEPGIFGPAVDTYRDIFKLTPTPDQREWITRVVGARITEWGAVLAWWKANRHSPRNIADMLSRLEEQGKKRVPARASVAGSGAAWANEEGSN